MNSTGYVKFFQIILTINIIHATIIRPYNNSLVRKNVILRGVSSLYKTVTEHILYSGGNMQKFHGH